MLQKKKKKTSTIIYVTEISDMNNVAKQLRYLLIHLGVITDFKFLHLAEDLIKPR